MRLLPARWCKPSTFCVISKVVRPRRSNSASAKCAPFGLAAATSGQPSMLRAQ